MKMVKDKYMKVVNKIVHHLVNMRRLQSQDKGNLLLFALIDHVCVRLLQK